ncbi:ABC transporter permease [Chelatococcus sp.]|uniref:cell division protein FtsX n=1 Tax=Chelatococcus sp. TaxID=1953771 RepID=UPI0025C660DD|nr:ABC transporter permease [Chelatococcus sp.]
MTFFAESGQADDTPHPPGSPDSELGPLPEALKRNQSLVPSDSSAGRALVTVIAILTFLAALAAGAAQLVASASSEWNASIAREATIQVRPNPQRDIEADVAAAADIARADVAIDGVLVYSRAEAERLLSPWLGTTLDFVELPIPRLIVLTVKPGIQPDFATLRSKLAAAVPGTTIDDHRAWIARLSAMAGTVVFGALAIVGLVLVAAALAIASATRGAVASNREILEVLHFVGADDQFIAREYQRRFLGLGLKGGLIGGGAALLCLIVGGMMARYWRASPGGDQLEALFGLFDIGIWGYASVAAIAVIIALVTAAVSRTTVRRHLSGLQ